MTLNEVYTELVNFALSVRCVKFDDKGLRRMAWLVYRGDLSMNEAKDLGLAGMFVIRGRAPSENGSTQKWNRELQKLTREKVKIYG